jgi:hypothetical protein
MMYIPASWRIWLSKSTGVFACFRTDVWCSQHSYDELSELGRFLVGLSRKDAPEGATKSLTWTQHRKLAEEMVVYDEEERIVRIPDSLFIDDPFFKRWIEEMVYPVLRNRSGVDKPVNRDRLVKAVTLAGSDGFEIREYFEWRKPESARAEAEQKRREMYDPVIRKQESRPFLGILWVSAMS